MHDSGWTYLSEEFIEDLETIQKRKDIKVAVVCCSWPRYKELRFHPETKVLTPWKTWFEDTRPEYENPGRL